MTTQRRKPGRPPGDSEKGLQRREHLYWTAGRLFASRGYEGTTMRDIAAAAGVSLGLLYRYFPSKDSLVFALYDELSCQYAENAAQLPQGRWPLRFLHLVRMSLETLAPHRSLVRTLIAASFRDPQSGLFAPRSDYSRTRVQVRFVDAVVGAAGCPDDPETLGKCLYAVHLLILLTWLMDQSEEQAVTRRLLESLEERAAGLELLASLPLVREVLRSATSGLAAI